MISRPLSLLVLSTLLTNTNAAFGVATPPSVVSPTSTSISTSTSTSTSTALYAGFGGGGASSKKGGKKGKKSSSSVSTAMAPLKPKKQWDYYTSDKLKGETRVAVGVRVLDDSEESGENTNPWLTVGYVKSMESKHSVYALLRQRALVAEHAKRLFPLKIKSNARVEWGYVVEESEGEEEKVEWVVVNTKEFDSLEVPAGAEKSIGFEGFCDIGTGFYCQYHEGKLVSESLSAAASKYI